MAKRRKLEAHKLTISGIGDNANYVARLLEAGRSFRFGAEWPHAGKTHAVREMATQNDGRLAVTFISYKTGERPDVIDTQTKEIEPSPLGPNQTELDYTHALVAKVGDRWVLVVEKTQGGIWPNAVGLFFDHMLSSFIDGDIVVSVEPDPQQAFVDRIDALQRVTRASYEVVRPNPGWADLEGELAEESQQSRAARAEIGMTAKRGESLAKNRGIVSHIKARARQRSLGGARIAGYRSDGKPDEFSAQQMTRAEYVTVRTDEAGKVIATDIFQKINRIADQG